MTTQVAVRLRALIRDTASFERKLEILETEGQLSRGASILFARKNDAAAYNIWARKRQHRGMAELQTL